MHVANEWYSLTCFQFDHLQNMDEAHCSPGLHAAAGPGLAEECAALVCYLLIDLAIL